MLEENKNSDIISKKFVHALKKVEHLIDALKDLNDIVPERPSYFQTQVESARQIREALGHAMLNFETSRKKGAQRDA